LQRRQRRQMNIVRPLPARAARPEAPATFDSGDYASAMRQMRRNALRWNS
jgi:hypothetical protein